MGFALGDDELISAPVAARIALEKLQQQVGRSLRIWPLVASAIQTDFSDFIHDKQQPDYAVLGAQQLGMRGCLVKTGKFREAYFMQSGIKPDFLVDSVAQLAAMIKSLPT